MNVSAVTQNNTITLARALLALGTLITLVFTPIADIFPVHHLLELKGVASGLGLMNIFLWFDKIILPYCFAIVILLVVILGYFPRYLCFLHTWITYSLFHSMLIVEGGDQINAILTLLLIPICLIDGRRNGWKSNAVEPANAPAFLYFNAKYSLLFIGIQMAVLYFNASVSKMFAPEWTNGTATYYWFYDNMFGAPAWLDALTGSLFRHDISVSLITWSVILLELLLFVGFFLEQKYKYILFVLGVTFHFFVILVHGLPTFFLAMTGGLVLFYFRLDCSISENLRAIKGVFKRSKSEIEPLQFASELKQFAD